MIWIAISAITILLSGAANAADCRQVIFETTPLTICEADPARDDLRLFLNDADGKPHGSFNNVNAELAQNDQTLTFALNAGMYHPDRSPVGLYVEDGIKQANIVTRDGPGNFALLPNGVFCLHESAAKIIESRVFAKDTPNCRFATQSGPILVIDGKLHPRFLPNSDSRYIRNGVGVTNDGRVITAISDRPVNFHRFARFFRDVLETPNALYFDGNVSRLYAPGLDRHDAGFPMGPILGVVAPAK